jgi:hypothetical protein
MMLLKKNCVLLRKHLIQLPRQFEKVWILLTMKSERLNPDRHVCSAFKKTLEVV